VVAPREAASLPLQPDDVHAKVLLAQVRLLQQRAADAESLALQALAQVQGSTLRDRFRTLEAEVQLRLGQARQRDGRASTARAPLEHALALRSANEADLSPRVAEARIALAECLLDLGERGAAQALLAQARSAHAAHAELAPHYAQPLQAAQARLRAAVAQR
jgi:hypothetical protein